MNDQKRAIFDALNGIDPELIEEAAQIRHTAPRTRLLRFTAAAAVLAVLLTCLFFLPDGKSEPLFFVSVMANDELNVTVTMTARIVKDLPEVLDPSWEKQEVFCVEVRMDNALPEYLAASKVTVEYMGRNVTENAAWQQLSVQFPEDNSDGTLCRVYGWAKDLNEDRLNFTVTVSNTADGAETILCAQPFEAFYRADDDNHLYVNKDLTFSGEYSVTMEILSTEELVDLIYEDENSPWAPVFSSYEHEVGYITNYYEGVLAVLRTREDASEVMLNRMQKYAQMTPEERGEGPVYYPFSAAALHIILSDSYFKDQLSEENRQWFEDFEFWKTIAVPQDKTPTP